MKPILGCKFAFGFTIHGDYIEMITLSITLKLESWKIQVMSHAHLQVHNFLTWDLIEKFLIKTL
jgi:hypothetical protein